jgi:2-polyprenyl-6-methoxyphenol hydroxylase-like FAD-dependent oxidoreductase
MKSQQAIVLGGGIGGLACAIALHRAGWRVKVLEQAPQFGEVGAGISLWPNSLRALDMLGVGKAVREIGGVESAAGFRHKNGAWLFRSNIEALEKAYGQTILIHRAELINILVNALPKEVLVLGAKATNIETDGVTATVTHTKGTDTADLLVAADGIHSATRTTFWPDAKPPQYAGYTTWRFIAPKLDIEPETSESWGSAERVGIFPFSNGQIYSYLGASVPPGGKSQNELIELKRRFSSWHEPIPTLLNSINPDVILRNDIYTVPPLDTYVKENIVLVGDAAHAMTPDFGEGGGTALEDAVELARILAKAPDLASGLQEYDAIRRPRTQTIARQSAQFGKIAQWSWPPAVAVRNTITRLLPHWLFIKALKPMLSWGNQDSSTRSIDH